MEETSSRQILWNRLRDEAERDPRVVALLDYGSSSEGRADTWSDVDAAVIVRDADFATFEAGWREWLARFGQPLATFLYAEHHPWAVYDVASIPLRADFSLHPESAIGEIADWPNAPTSVAAMIRFDRTDEKLVTAVQRLVGKSLAPVDPEATFERAGGLFWYELLRAYGKLRRGQPWASRFEFNFLVTGLLHALLRLEVGRTERWQAAESAVVIEDAISAERLAQLQTCIPGPSDSDLLRAMLASARLGRETGAVTAAREGWVWPRELGERVVAILAGAVAAEEAAESI